MFNFLLKNLVRNQEGGKNQVTDYTEPFRQFLLERGHIENKCVGYARIGFVHAQIESMPTNLRLPFGKTP